jgi:tryptophan synthase beta chain
MFGLQCEIYMGTEDMQRQALNVFRMRLLGSTVTGVDAGSRTLKDAISEAMRDWTTNIETTHYILGSVLGAHPYPMMIRDFQSIIGKEARKQVLAVEGRLPDSLIACVGGGSNAMGLFSRFLRRQKGQDDRRRGRRAWGGQRQACSPVFRRLAGRIARNHDVSVAERGRPDRPDPFGIRRIGLCRRRPEHSYLREIGRTTYTSATDEEALAAFDLLAREEGIVPALESAHAIAHVVKMAPTMKRQQVLLSISRVGETKTSSRWLA